MKEIFRQYGKALLSGIFLLLMLAAVSEASAGLRSLLSADASSEEYKAVEDETFTSYWTEGGLTISLKQDCLVSNQRTALSELVSAEDSQGRSADLRVRGIYRVNENILPETGAIDLLKQKGSACYTSQSGQSGEEISLPTGCYRIRLEAEAANGRRHPVDILVLARP